MASFAAACAAWSLVWAIACFADAAWPRFVNGIVSTTAYCGLLLAINAAACALAALAALTVRAVP